jgi:YgiT-type zinc finger domain-containing protein
MRRVVREVETRVGLRRMVVPDIEVEECGRCGERLYDLAALRKIRDARGPARRRRAA